ncbi:hypothetical protein DFH06DRAFT_1318182 [Mycena polygramma]|nr:hypothetical protein DFH06DRAFT_1318182 [Mycena polygramma]
MSSAEGIAETGTSNPVWVQAGMEKGFALSAMADLRREYLTEPDDEPSLFMRVTAIASKKALDVHEIMDRGVSTNLTAPTSRFGLETGFNMRTERTITDMQSLLKRAAGMVAGRESCFIIDPHRTMITLLRNARELNELHVAWLGLSRRMELAQKNLDKYESEFKAGTEEEVLLSPISTAPEIYSVFPRNKGPASDVNYMFDHVPHLQTLLPSGYDKETGWLPHHIEAPQFQLAAFPDRPAEPKPSTVYYSAEGERREIAISSRSSRGSPGEFELPPIEGPEKSRRTRHRSPQREKKKDRRKPSTKLDTPATQPAAVPASSAEITRMVPDYKNSETFFVPRSPSNRAYGMPKPGPHLPNPLVGMASAVAAPYSLENDSISQFKGKARDDGQKRRPYEDKGTTRTSKLQQVPEADEDTPPASRNWRDRPPHLEAGPSQSAGQHPRGTTLRQGSVHSHRSQRRSGTRSGSRGSKGSGRRRSRSLASNSSREGLERGRRREREGAGGEEPSDDDSSSDSNGGNHRDRRERPPPRRRRTPAGHRPARPPSPSDDPSDGDEDSDGDSWKAGDGRYSFPYIAPGAPYGTVVPTIEPKLKVESLPEWDGNHSTAIDYFWEVSQVANLDGWLPRALGFWLPSRLKKESPVYLWFSTLPTARQAEMRSHYLVYLQVIKDRYLGKRWQLLMNLQFESQSFRQEGHEDESPQTFLGRRTKYVRLLANADDGGPVEVYLTMLKAPIAWSTIVVLQSIKTAEELYERVNEHEKELVEAFTRNGPDSVTTKNLASTLRRLGFTPSSGGADNRRPFRRANFTEVDVPETVEEEPKEENVSPADNLGSASGSSGPLSDDTVRQAYQILKSKQRPPPKGGYKFAKNDHVTTKMGRAPPSPCKVCGSANHWDRECPDWDTYLERQRRGVLVVTRTPAADEAETIYHSAYCVLRESRIEDASF